jgi:NAD(P)-dependent dehydrogenase (short-subunit alcohol dehydrogenase family)
MCVFENSSMTKKPTSVPPQTQEIPGSEKKMTPQPETKRKEGMGCDKLHDKVALISGGDSGIGRAVAIAFAQEDADVAIIYNINDEDANDTKKMVESEGGKCLVLKGDIGDESFCKEAIEKTIEYYGKLDILINNAAEQHPQKSITEITEEQLEKTFRTNIFSYFFLTKAALPHLKEGSVIINTTSVTAYKGSAELLDYSSTKGAIVAFTRSLSQSLAEQGIRVNGVAPGPIWTPLIPSTFDEEKVENFGKNVPLKRVGQPVEVAPSFVFLASEDSSYMTGQILHPNGGTVVNG